MLESSSSIKILNVAGEHQARRAASRALENAGFGVFDAGSAAEALTRVEECAPDAILLVLPLPDGDGLGLCRRLRESTAGAAAVILLIGEGPAEPRAHAAALESGADAYLAGPADPDLMAVAARRMLRKRPAGLRLEAVLEATTDSVVTLDRRGRLTYWNQRARNSIGRGRDLIGQVIWEAFPESVDTMFAREYLAVARSRTESHFESYYAPLDAWFEVHGHPNEEGMTVFFRDITDRKKSEIEREKLIESLRESEDLFHTLADTISPLAWMADGTGWVFWYNRRWYEYTGTTFEQMQGWGWQTVHHPEHVERVVERLRHNFETGEPWEDVFPLRGKDGGYRWFLSRAQPIRDVSGRVVRWFGTNTDITERLEMEDQLRRALGDASNSRSQLEAVFEAIQDGMMVLNMDGGVVLANTALARLAGYRDRSEVPRRLHEYAMGFDLFRLDGTPLMMDEWPAACVLRGESFTDLELRVRNPAIEQEWIFSFSGKPVHDADGEQVLAVLVLRDVTGRKRAEEQMVQAQKLEGIGLLAGGIAHDFNNLLGSVMGYASLLEDEVPRASVDKVQAIVEASRRAADLTRQLLAYAGKGTFVVQRVDLTRAVREMMQLLQSSISKKVRVEEDLMADLAAVEADAGQIQQIVMNLALNAAEAIPENHAGTVRMRTFMEEVPHNSRRMDDLTHAPIAPGRYVCLEVGDTGIGMDEATKARIFDPFFTTKFTGRGLGLAAVGGIVRSHGGAIQIQSGPGRGTTMCVLLPAHGQADESGPLPGAAVGAVLVVDDEPMIRSFARAALERSGYQVHTAEGGREALALIEQRATEFDVVLLDLLMPDMRGDEVADALAQSHPDMPVVVMSGYSESEAAPIFAGKPVAGFLQKPFPASQMVGQIESVMRSRRFRRG